MTTPTRIQKLGILLIASMGTALCSCSTPSKPLSTSNRIPAGKGTLSTRTDSNENTNLKISVNHLAPASRVAEGAQSYVVWIDPLGNRSHPINLGSLAINNNLSGNFETTTPFKTFDLFITAEPSAQTLQPSGERMLWAQVNHGKVG